MPAPGEIRPTPAQEPPPRVVVIATGGTIASRTRAPQLTGESLVEAVPQIREVARIEVEEFSRIGSSRMTPDHWLRLARRVNELFGADQELAGIVVTHGTDTMEETSYLLHLTVRDERPVVVTGSMRSADAVSADGPANLLSAIRVAVSREAVGKGVLVVLNDEIHGAREARKMDNLRVDAFRSPDAGPLGVADPDRVLFYRKPVRRHTTGAEFDLVGVEALPRVELIQDYAGFDGSSIRWWGEREIDGLVVVGFGGGRLSAGAGEAAVEVARSLPVAIASRVPGGRILERSVVRDGRRMSMAEAGMAVARNLPGHKARVLLTLALTRTRDAAGIQRMFDEY